MVEQPVHRVVAGFGRSGTTWIQDVLARANSLRAVFEPLHPRHVDGADAYAHRYVPETRQEPELYSLLHQFFCESYPALWADYRVVKQLLLPRRFDLTSWHRCKQVLSYYVLAKDNFLRFNKQRKYPQRIVKLIRANMMLPWLQANFGARIIFVIRHPAAVIMSQMNAPMAWYPHDCIERYCTDSDLLDILDDQTRRLLFQSIDDVEAYALSWCIENTVALDQAQKHGIPIVHYELLLNRGMPEWKRILSALELDHMPDEQLISKPSQQAWGRKATDSALIRNYSSWMEDIDKCVLTRIQRILDATGMKFYSVDNPLPNSGSEAGS